MGPQLLFLLLTDRDAELLKLDASCAGGDCVHFEEGQRPFLVFKPAIIKFDLVGWLISVTGRYANLSCKSDDCALGSNTENADGFVCVCRAGLPRPDDVSSSRARPPALSSTRIVRLWSSSQTSIVIASARPARVQTSKPLSTNSQIDLLRS